MEAAAGGRIYRQGGVDVCIAGTMIIRIHIISIILNTPDGEFVKPWEYNMDCYTALCRDCHNGVHDKYRIKSYYISRS